MSEVTPHCAAPNVFDAQKRCIGVLRRIGWVERAGLAGVLLITLIAATAPWLTTFDPILRSGAPYLTPSALHWFGTDEAGRDLFSRVVMGIRATWLPGLAVILVSLVLGGTIGAISGLVGGKIDLVIQGIIDLFLILPATLLALALIAALGPGMTNTMIALTVTWWPWYARLCRDEIKRLAARPHVEAARVAGSRGGRLLTRHLMPGAVPALIVAASLDMANVVMAVSLLSFLGLGQPAPAPELGAMTARSLESLTAFWWLPILPAAVIFVLCLCANLTGDGLRAALRGL